MPAVLLAPPATTPKWDIARFVDPTATVLLSLGPTSRRQVAVATGDSPSLCEHVILAAATDRAPTWRYRCRRLRCRCRPQLQPPNHVRCSRSHRRPWRSSRSRCSRSHRRPWLRIRSRCCRSRHRSWRHRRSRVHHPPPIVASPPSRRCRYRRRPWRDRTAVFVTPAADRGVHVAHGVVVPAADRGCFAARDIGVTADDGCAVAAGVFSHPPPTVA